MKKYFAFLLLSVIGQTVLAQDMIVKCNAEEINAKVMSVTATEVEYRKTDNPEGPLYKLPIEEIFFIKYQNGTKDVFAKAPTHNRHLQTGPGPAYIPRQQLKNQYTAHYPRYQGEIALAYGIGVGSISHSINTDRSVVETVHGVRINSCVFVGGGVGYNVFYSMFEPGDALVNPVVIPIFANVKSYYPITNKFSLYMSLDLGMAIYADKYAESTELYTSIGPGINFGRAKGRPRGDFSIRFQHMGEGTNAILLRAGFGF